jgi:eukaryotic-like serine/threonine-protein kinase
VISLPLPATLPQIGERILGKYEVERVLGVGGMGVVVAARHLQLGQRVAIKFVLDQVASDSNVAARFLREARAAGALSSEHVAKVIDFGTLESGAPFMVMEYLAGEDLAVILEKDGSLPISEAVLWVLQACEAIAEAHALGIVHRDLKPSNLFITRRADGSKLVKVLDFGISKTTDATMSQGLTLTGSLMGSPAYMSPEQLRSPKTVDARSDVWAIGIILYELLAGKSPFLTETLGETFARIVSDPPQPLQVLRAEVPEGLAAVVGHCLEKDVSLRVPSVAALASRLLPYAPHEGKLSVERILRIANATTGESRTDTLAASGSDGAASFNANESTRNRGSRTATGSVWQTSDGHATTPKARGLLMRSGLLAAGASVLVAGGGLAAFALRAPQTGDSSSRSSSASSLPASPARPAPFENAVRPPPAPMAASEPARPEPADPAAPEAGSTAWSPPAPPPRHTMPTSHESPLPAIIVRKKAAPAPSASTTHENDIF